MSLEIKWINHATFRISYGDEVIYIDPWKLKKSRRDATLVLISHDHHDHFSTDDIEKVRQSETRFISSADVVEKYGDGIVLKPGQAVKQKGVTITGVHAYNPNKRFHLKQNEWLGFVIDIASKRIYYAGDTDITDQMKELSDIDIALLPVGGTYTMNAQEAAKATEFLKPKTAIPYHWGDIIGERTDAERFAELADCKVTILLPGQSWSPE